MPAASRPALSAGTTHLLYFAHWCGASRLDRARGQGLWFLMTAGEYAAGLPDSTRDDWYAADSKRVPVRDLTAWVSRLLGCPVTLTRSDHLKDPAWVVAYQVSRR